MNIEITEVNEDILELQNNYLHLQNSPPHPPNDNNINQIMINSDCFEYFDKIPSNSVDLILTDPPYNSTHNDFDKNEVDLDYLWYNYIRVLKPSGIIIMFADNLFMAKLIMSNVSWFKYTLVWEKNKFSDFMNAKKKPLKIHENICVFYNKTPITYNIQYFYGEPYKRSNKQETIDKKEQKTYNKYKSMDIIESTDGKRYPTTILKYSRVERPKHPTQKPVNLLEFLIKSYSNEDDLVLDNFAGIGSTLIACKNTNRKCIGIEIDKKYCDIYFEQCK